MGIVFTVNSREEAPYNVFHSEADSLGKVVAKFFKLLEEHMNQHDHTGFPRKKYIELYPAVYDLMVRNFLDIRAIGLEKAALLVARFLFGVDAKAFDARDDHALLIAFRTKVLNSLSLKINFGIEPSDGRESDSTPVIIDIMDYSQKNGLYALLRP